MCWGKYLATGLPAGLQVPLSCLLPVRPSAVIPHGTNQLPLDGFSLNLTLAYFCFGRRNSNFIKIGQE
jgi:hypothetical protein